MESAVQKYIELLGLPVKEKVTGVEGVVTSVSFDLYGCVQCCVDRGFDKDGKERLAWWFDHKRLEVKGKKPVMEQPFFQQPGTERGPAEKPLP